MGKVKESIMNIESIFRNKLDVESKYEKALLYIDHLEKYHMRLIHSLQNDNDAFYMAVCTGEAALNSDVEGVSRAEKEKLQSDLKKLKDR